ncbi:hypothetical protein RJ55_07572 [Drechmeria coniospora]|nr:hypothetical protein RJ55_07572 [Drechmeria coniospora]
MGLGLCRATLHDAKPKPSELDTSIAQPGPGARPSSVVRASTPSLVLDASPMAVMEESAVWKALPADEQRSVWDETEGKFWRDFEQEQEAMRVAADSNYKTAVADVRLKLGTLTRKRTQLDQARERLTKELTQVEEELAHVVQDCDGKVTMLSGMEQEFRKQEHERLKKREQVAQTMEVFFFRKRGEDAAAAAGSTCGQRRPPPRLAQSSRPRPSWQDQLLHPDPAPVDEGLPSRPAPGSAAAKLAPPSVDEADVLVNIVDADGNVIGPVRKVDDWNQWVAEVQRMPVRRPVRIRRGRKFGQEHLAAIYERAESKGVKWLSCMIQATGEVQAERCQSCDRNQGAFEECVILGGHLFQKCGNCEWNRQGCHAKSGGNFPTVRAGWANRDAAGGDDRLASIEARTLEAAQEALAKAAGLPRPVAEVDVAMREDGVEPTDVAVQQPPRNSPAIQEVIQMPTPQEPKEYASSHSATATSATSPSTGFVAVNDFVATNGASAPVVTPAAAAAAAKSAPAIGFTPANARGKHPLPDNLTPSVASAENSPWPVDVTSAASESPIEITRENLVLRHNGHVYTYPEIVEGVPLAKIDMNHPYWELGWPSLRSVIEPQLALWSEKNAAALEARNRGEKGSAKFQTGRQVNRGIKILEFLDSGDISPYQLVSKKFMHTGKGAITSYDTLFRLCETLSELAKFKNLGVTPVEWIRHRLHEIMMETGPKFNVARVIHDFYHDKKLAALRAKNGFKSIGRPSGYKPGRSGGTPADSSKKRKSTHSCPGTPHDTPSRVPSPLAPERFEQSPVPSRDVSTVDVSFDTYPIKRIKCPSPASQGTKAELEAGVDYSDADSRSGASLTMTDWRVYQVKTKLFTSSTSVTQYWSWKEQERLFEHQVLKDTEPVTWGVHRKPIDFNVHAKDVHQVKWNSDALQVHLVMATSGAESRGDVMAAFKRWHTLRRFVTFCREKGMEVVEVSPDDMEDAWAAMKSEQSHRYDEEAAKELKG